jgi:hypothetical protein
MHRNAAYRNLAMVAMVCMVCMLVLQGVTTMATTNVTKALTTGSKATSNVALAPHTHAQPTLPSTQPAANWQLVGSPSTAKQAVNGVGPAPKQGTVGYAALACINAAGKQGATLVAVQAAITAVGLRGKHPVMPLLTWLAKHRGYSFTCTNGYVTLA